jgi:hypothetical protein
MAMEEELRLDFVLEQQQEMRWDFVLELSWELLSQEMQWD